MENIVNYICIKQLIFYGNLYINGNIYKKYGAQAIIDFFREKGLKVHLDVIDDDYIDGSAAAFESLLKRRKRNKELRCIVILDETIHTDK